MSIFKQIKYLKREFDFWWFYKNFYNKFKFYTSEEKSELEELYKIRYSVYCEEYKYIETHGLKDGLEYDQWDDHSIHFIIRNGDNNIAATVRLILNSGKGFPIEKNFQLSLDVNKLEKNKVCEISRLIVAKKYRKHHLMFVLIKGIYQLVKKENIQYLYSVMDDRLFKLLNIIGIPFKQIGKEALYQGITKPYILDCNQFDQDLRQNNKRLFYYLNQGGIEYNVKNNSYSLH